MYPELFIQCTVYIRSILTVGRRFTNTVHSCKDNRDWWPTSLYCGGRIFYQIRLSTCCSLPCMYIVQVVCTRHRLLPDVLVACVEASMTSQMCRQDNRDCVNILSNVIEGLLATRLWHCAMFAQLQLTFRYCCCLYCWIEELLTGYIAVVRAEFRHLGCPWLSR